MRRKACGGATDTETVRLGLEALIRHAAKPLRGIGSGVLEIALPHKGDAFRVVYALQLGEDLWVIHAFPKKSATASKLPSATWTLCVSG